MKNMNQHKGFTLAEIMVVLFILTIILAAFAPIMTTRTKNSKASPWTYANPDTANAYFGVSANQRAMLGQKSKGENDINNKLTINTSSAAQADILFKEGGTALGQLAVNSNGTTVLGAYPEQEAVGSYNTVIGSGALPSATTDKGSTAIGAGTLYNASGNYNTALGFNACHGGDPNDGYTAIGGYTTCIGAFSGPNGHMGTEGSTTDNKLYLGNNKTTVYIGTQDIKTYLGIESESSDRRLKNVKGENLSGLDKIKKITTYDYTFKSDEQATPHVGVMAQDLQKVFPNAVVKGTDGYLKIRKEDMFYAMINAIKELANLDNAKDKKIKELEKKNAELEARLLKLEKKVNKK